MKPSIILSITLVLAFTICQEVKSQFNFNDLNEQQCLYFENNNNRMLLQCTNNHDVAAAYFQMIAPGTSPAYYLIAVKFRGESQFFKYKFYNPSGNVLTDSEIRTLAELAHRHSIPLIVDNAYGLPFPDIVFTDDAQPVWNEDIILSMSLSKIGLPSIRTGIVIARADIARAVGNINAIAALATGSFGPALAHEMLESGELTDLARNVVRPFYKEKAARAEALIRKYFEGTDYYLHRIEGSIFCWIYLPSLRIPTLEFYSLLMEEGVVTVPGEYFFFGGAVPYPHEHYDKCLRLNYSGDGVLVEEGIEIIARKYRQWSK